MFGRKRLRVRCAAAAAALTLAGVGACGDDDPTGVGAPLFPPGALRSFEVVLEAPDFLVADTTFNGFDPPAATSLLVVAEDFEGVLDAHALVDFATLPTQVTYRDSAGNAQTDTMPRFTRGDFVLRLASPPLGGGLIEIGVYALTESWHTPTATWTARADTAEAGPEPWTMPGGTRGELIASGTAGVRADSVFIPIDELGIEALRDSTVAANGVVLVAETPGVRLEAQSIELRLEAIPAPRPDTTVTTTVGAVRTTFVFVPEAPQTPGVLYAAGTPGWRAALELSSALDTLSVPCPEPAPAGCRIALNEATITRAELLLEPEPPPPAYRPGDSVLVVLRPALRSPLIPIVRSPLQDVVGAPVMPEAALFEPPSGPDEDVAVEFTGFFRNLVAQRDSAVEPPSRTLVLLGNLSRPSFGFAGFGSADSAVGAPRLRLVLTVPEEVLRP